MIVRTMIKMTTNSAWNLRGGICSVTGRPKIECCTGIANEGETEGHSVYGDMGGCNCWSDCRAGIRTCCSERWQDLQKDNMVDGTNTSKPIGKTKRREGNDKTQQISQDRNDVSHAGDASHMAHVLPHR